MIVTLVEENVTWQIISTLQCNDDIIHAQFWYLCRLITQGPTNNTMQGGICLQLKLNIMLVDIGKYMIEL